LPADDRYRNLNELCSMLEHYYNGDAFQRVIYADSHDSAANGGRRLAEGITPGEPTSMYARRRSLQAAALALTAPGIPMLFQGQEFLTGGSFNDWESLDWEASEKFGGIVDAHRHLVGLRRNSYGNTRGLLGNSINIIHMNEAAKVLAYHRWDQGGPGDDVMVIFNFSNQAITDYSMGFPKDGAWNVRFSSDWKGYSPDFTDVTSTDIEAGNNNANISIGPYSVLILSQG
jgi:1,4-alpha-glucan branching enzyme